MLKFIILPLQFLQIQWYNLFRLLGVIFDSFFFWSYFIYFEIFLPHIRDLRRIRRTLDHNIACTVAISLIHSKLDYCNLLHLNINSQQLDRLQLILTSAALAVTKAPSHYSTPEITLLAQIRTTHTQQNTLTYKSLHSTTNLPPFLIFLPYNQLVLPAPPQLSFSNAIPIPLSSKFLTDLSTFKLLLFGMLYQPHLRPILCYRYLLIIFTNCGKLIFSFIPILFSLSLYWTDPLELWYGLLLVFIIHFTSFILDSFIC